MLSKTLLAASLLLSCSFAFANNTSGSSGSSDSNDSKGSYTCPNYWMQAQNPFSHCFDSMFPMRIGGQDVIRGGGVGAPHGAHKKKICKCTKWYWKIPRGYWHATRLVDVTKSPTCSPSQGPYASAMLNMISRVTSNTTRNGGIEDAAVNTKYGFFHVHSWKYPFGTGLRTWVQGGQLETSLTNPFWKSADPIRANWLFPEYLAFAKVAKSPLVDAATQAAVCLAETTGIGQQATDMMYWISGCGENALPTSGHLSSSSSTVTAHMAILSRYLNMSNRTGGFAARSNVGEKAWCSATPTPFPMKSEFKVSMVAPYSENSTNSSGMNTQQISQGAGQFDGSLAGIVGQVASYVNLQSRCDHRMGTSEYRWGLGKSDQSLKTNDEDATYIIWRWVDAC